MESAILTFLIFSFIDPSFKIILFFYQTSTYIFWTFLYGFQGRCLALIQAASDVQEQGGVHDSDHFLHAIRDMLKIYSSEDLLIKIFMIYSSYSGLIIFLIICFAPFSWHSTIFSQILKLKLHCPHMYQLLALSNRYQLFIQTCWAFSRTLRILFQKTEIGVLMNCKLL